MNKATKTKEQLAHALIELLNTRPLDLITIKLLCEKANVGRTAFYNNFKNKDDVLKYIYRKAHKEAFQDKFKSLDYLRSDEYIKDMITFFDKNTSLLQVLDKWNLIDIIARYNTEISENYISEYVDPVIKKYADYFNCYTGVMIFNICILWIKKNKDISSKSLFNIIKYFKDL